MLMADRAKFLGLVFGEAFAALLITQQASIFIGLMVRTGSTIVDAADADVWVMDPSVEYLDTVFALRETDLLRVRGGRRRMGGALLPRQRAHPDRGRAG